LTPVSPSLEIYSVTTATIQSNKLSIPIKISGTEVKENVETLGLTDSGAGGKVLIKTMPKQKDSNYTNWKRPCGHTTWMELKTNEEPSRIMSN
jgi:hypothetical protein